MNRSGRKSEAGRTSTEKMKKEFLRTLMVLLLLLTGAMSGYLSYQRSFDLVLRYAGEALTEEARSLSVIAGFMIVHRTPEQTVSALETVWNRIDTDIGDEYLCIIDSSSKVLLDTGDPERKGSSAGDIKIYSLEDGSEEWSLPLSAENTGILGRYVSRDGAARIAAFARDPYSGFTIGIYKQENRFFGEINRGLRVFFYIFILTFGLLIPFIILVFYRLIRRSREKELRTLKKLGDTEERLLAFLDNSITGCFIYQDDTFKFVNSKFLEILGFGSMEELKDGFSMSDIQSRDGTATLREFLLEQLKGGEDHFRDIFKVSPVKEETRWMEIFCDVIDFEGGPASFGIVIDITERKKNEDELNVNREDLERTVGMRTRDYEEQLDKLNRSQRAMLFMIEDLNRTSKKLKDAQDELLLKERLAVLGQFSGSISHELRNPLGVIDSSAYFLRSVLKDQDEKISRHLDHIKKGVATSISIIESLLNLTRMKKPVTERNDLTGIINEVISEIKRPPDIAITRDFHSERIWIECELLQIKIALKNLLKNALQSMKEEGEIAIVTRPGPDHMVMVSIKDSGTGIRAEDIRNIFQPLFTQKAEGIGFGLTITKMIIENHGGNIRVESEWGKGTEFILHIPALDIGGGDKEKI